MAITIAEVRQKYPQYSDLSDQELSDALHQNFYSDMPKAEFESSIGLKTTPPQDFQRKPTFGEQVKSVAYPVAEAIGTGLGGLVGTGVGPAGTIAGSALGYAGVKGLENVIDQYTGAAKPETIGQAAARTAKDIATGATYEMGGQLLGKGLSAGATLGSKVIKDVTGKTAAETAASVEKLKQSETQAWDKVKDSTTTFKDPIPLKDSVDELLSPKKFNYDPRTFSAVKPAVEAFNDIYESGIKGISTDIHEMRTVRTMLQDVRMSGGAKPDEKRLAGELMDKLDNYVLQHGGEDAAAWKDARDISNKLFRSRDVQGIVKAAEESSKATSKEIRSQFGDLLNSYQIKMYTPEQQAVIKQIAEGTATEKTLEMIGSLAPKNPGWNNIKTLLGVGGAYHAAGVPGAIAAYTTGEAARSAANMLARQRVNMLDELIRGGKIPQTIELPQPIQRVLPAGVNVLANQTQRQ